MLSEDERTEDFSISGSWLGFLLLGVTLLMSGIVIVVVSVFLDGSGSVGGIILFGPIPIIFGAGPESTLLIKIIIVIAMLSITLFIFMNRRGKKKIVS